MTNIEAMKLAVRALKANADPTKTITERIALEVLALGRLDLAISEAEQAEQEPSAWMNTINGFICKEKTRGYHAPLYTAPPQREWMSLTDDEIEDIWMEWSHMLMYTPKQIMRAVEAKLKEKNCG